MKKLSTLINELTNGRAGACSTAQIARKFGIQKVGAFYVCTPKQELDIIKNWKNKHRIDKTATYRLVDILRKLTGVEELRPNYMVTKIANDFDCVKVDNTWLCDGEQKIRLENADLDIYRIAKIGMGKTEIKREPEPIAVKILNRYLNDEVSAEVFLAQLDIIKEVM